MSRTPTATDVCTRFPLSDPASALLLDTQSPRQFLDVLMEQSLRLDAIRLVAHTFSKRSAVWWGVLCIEELFDEFSDPSASAAVKAARTWVIEPSDENRRAAMPLAEATGMETPAGSLAAAVWFAGDSVAPPDLKPAPPPKHVTADLLFASLVAASALPPAVESPQRMDRFLQLAIELTERKHLWPGATPDTPPE